jgi:hypothetical protein
VSKWDYSVALDIGGSHMNAESKGTRKQSTFGYSLSPDEEVGFYVVCSDRMILDSINSLMKNRGYIGISDTAGRLHYMVDARSGIRAAVNHITTEANRKLEYSSLSNACILETVEEILKRYELDRGLLGTRIVRYILIQSLRDPTLLTVVSKRLYPLAGKEFGISASQVERNLRYAFSRITLYREGLRNVHILQHLHDEVAAMLVERYDCRLYSCETSG